MNSPVTPRTGPARWPLAAFAIALVLACALAALRPWAEPSETASASGDALPVIAPAPLALPDEPTILVFGDSWVYGSAATEPTGGFAYRIADLLSATTIVDGVRASGYLREGIDGPEYGTRIAALDPDLDPDLIIVEGSINDRKLGADGYRAAVTSAWDALAATYPDAQILILGPAPQVLPVEEQTARIDADLSALAAARGWWYVSPIAEEWITEENYLDVIDTSAVGNDHPSDAGHAYLAEKVADAVERASAPADVIADADDDTSTTG